MVKLVMSNGVVRHPQFFNLLTKVHHILLTIYHHIFLGLERYKHREVVTSFEVCLDSKVDDQF